MNDTVQDIIKLLHSDLVNHNVAVHYQFDSTLPPVWGDRVQLQQVLINLIMNGCDAMAKTEISQRRLSVRTESANGHGTKISVGDQGCGIASDQLEGLKPLLPQPSQTAWAWAWRSAEQLSLPMADGFGQKNSNAGACFYFLASQRRGSFMTIPPPIVFVVDDDPIVLKGVSHLLHLVNWK